MRRLFSIIICVSLFSLFEVSAQEQNSVQQSAPVADSTTTSATSSSTTAPAAAAPVVVASVPKTDWLVNFSRLKIDGPMNVVMKRVATADEMRITYDTKGCITSKFKAEIDKTGTLVVEEKSDPKRTTVTDVIIYYTTLREVKIAHAKVDFENTIDSQIFDITVSGGAIVILDIDCLDIAVGCTGRTLLTLSGKTRYLTMRASSAKVNCSKLSTTSSTVDLSHGAEVRLNVTERLEATTSTSAKLIYKGRPTILRDHTSIFGGDIINIDD